MPDSQLDPVFEAGTETIEEAVLSALVHAETLTGFQGRRVYGLGDFFIKIVENRNAASAK
ncbi:hypothetical protein BTI59_00810 [Lactobacillus delbrueckii subsp. bulgaricus]|nr:hypothetical protein [Lactobacillus delbrueckii subsp. bulgaricus]